MFLCLVLHYLVLLLICFVFCLDYFSICFFDLLIPDKVYHMSTVLYCIIIIIIISIIYIFF